MAESERLFAIQSLVPTGARLLDIGSGDGLLPAALLEAGRIESAVVADVNKAPLSVCALNLARFRGSGRLSFLLSDGFEKARYGSFDAAAICGMGGELIARIIRDGGEKARVPLILQPMTKCEKLRAFLWDTGFRIERELFPVDGRRAYPVLLARYVGGRESYTAADTYLGKLRPRTEGFRLFAAAVKAAAEKRLAGALLEGNTPRAAAERTLIAEMNIPSEQSVSHSN